MTRVVASVRLLLPVLAAALALGVDQYACAQTQQKRPQSAPRSAQQAKRVDDRRWQELMVQAEAQMTSTFRNIKQGESALNAVSGAQHELRRGSYASGQYRFSRSHPFFWAAFVYVGD